MNTIPKRLHAVTSAIFTGALLVVFSSANSQLSLGSDLELSLELEHNSFIIFETINAFAKIENKTASKAVISDPDSGLPATINLFVSRFPNEEIHVREDRPVFRETVIEPGQSEPLYFNLTKWFDLARTGKYAVWMEVEWKSRTFKSNKVVFDIVRGIEILRTTRSVPGYDDFFLTYSLRYWSRPEKGRNYEFLFLSVDDLENETNYGVFDLGKIIRVSKPELNIDPNGVIQIVHQTAPDCFARSVFSVTGAGVYFIDQTYHLPSGAPYPSKSELNDEGKKKLVEPELIENKSFIKKWFSKIFSSGSGNDSATNKSK